MSEQIEAARPKTRPQQSTPLPFGADRLIVPPGLGGNVAAGTTRDPIKVTFPSDGEIVAVYAAGADPAGSLDIGTAAMFLQVQILADGEKNIISNGSSADWLPLDALTPRAGQWFKLTRQVNSNTPWMVLFRNLHSSADLMPQFAFAFRSKGQGR